MVASDSAGTASALHGRVRVHEIREHKLWSECLDCGKLNATAVGTTLAVIVDCETNLAAGPNHGPKSSAASCTPTVALPRACSCDVDYKINQQESMLLLRHSGSTSHQQCATLLLLRLWTPHQLCLTPFLRSPCSTTRVQCTRLALRPVWSEAHLQCPKTAPAPRSWSKSHQHCPPQFLRCAEFNVLGARPRDHTISTGTALSTSACTDRSQFQVHIVEVYVLGALVHLYVTCTKKRKNGRFHCLDTAVGTVPQTPQLALPCGQSCYDPSMVRRTMF